MQSKLISFLVLLSIINQLRTGGMKFATQIKPLPDFHSVYIIQLFLSTTPGSGDHKCSQAFIKFSTRNTKLYCKIWIIIQNMRYFYSILFVGAHQAIKVGKHWHNTSNLPLSCLVKSKPMNLQVIWHGFSSYIYKKLFIFYEVENH